jgi:hypothetical protein
MVQLWSDSDGAIITDKLDKVSCRRCLASRETKLRKLIAIEQVLPGVFDHDALCGEQWLLDHALDVKQEHIDKQSIEIKAEGHTISLPHKAKPKERRGIIRDFIRK